MKRYDHCDNTCTADCGHCKGRGKPASLSDRIHARFLVEHCDPFGVIDYAEAARIAALEVEDSMVMAARPRIAILRRPLVLERDDEAVAAAFVRAAEEDE